MWYFRNPLIVFGDDALEHLREIKGKRALIVTDAILVKLGYADKVARELKQAGIEQRVFAEVEPDPSVDTVKRGAQVALEYEPDWLIGLGGGSSMDAAKMIWMLYAQPDTEPYAIVPFQEYDARSKARMICIPTTAGTGSEVTWFMVVTDTAEQKKIGVGTPEALPDIAILDSRLVGDMPKGLVADTGMDALTHCVEGFGSTWRTDFTNGPALMAMTLIFKYLKRSFDDAADKEAREHMLNASALASMSWGNGMAGLAHNMGHALGGFFHVAHGKSVGLYLPYTMEYLAQAGAEVFAEAARFIGVEGKTDLGLTRGLISGIKDIARHLGQPSSVKALNISKADYEKVLPEMVSRAVSEANINTVLRIPDEKDMENIFLYAYEGKAVDF